jgi:hypothetical protein
MEPARFGAVLQLELADLLVAPAALRPLAPVVRRVAPNVST